MKKIIVAILFFCFLAGAFLAWKLFGPATAFSGNKYELFVRTGMNYQHEYELIEHDQVVSSPAMFNWLAKWMDYPKNIRAGKYEISRGMSLFDIIRMLRNGRQVPVKMVIIKFRTKEDFANYTGRRFECDYASMLSFLENNDSLRTFGLDSNTVLTAILPDTYTFFWNTTPNRIFKKLLAASQTYWSDKRIQQARDKGLTPAQVYIMASIVDEETTRQEDKSKIASVYLNRLQKKMKLAADPTVKYALRNFELKRVYQKYLLTESPYNTYKYAGLPPGPICIPSRQTIDAVLKAPATNYLYFVAKPDFSGYSNFSDSFEQHMKYAHEYQKALDIEMAKRAALDSLKR